jgi:hypothetical protein
MEEAVLPTIGEAIAGHPNARATFPNCFDIRHVMIRMKLTPLLNSHVSHQH